MFPKTVKTWKCIAIVSHVPSIQCPSSSLIIDPQCFAIAGGFTLFIGSRMASIGLMIAGTILLGLPAIGCLVEIVGGIVGCIIRHRQRKQSRHDELVRFRRERPEMHHELVQMRVPAQDFTVVISHPRPAVVHGGNGSVEKGSGQN